MKVPIFEAFFLLTASTAFGRHVYVDIKKSWSDAQRFCREFFTDLSPVASENARMTLRNRHGPITGVFWVGLYRDNLTDTIWKWSGVGPAKNIPWDMDDGQPLDIVYRAAADCQDWQGLRTHKQDYEHAFFCFSLGVIKMKVPWEKALSLCQQKGGSLVNLKSRITHSLAKAELDQANVNEPVWIGLRFLADRWLWMNGGSPNKMDWSPGSQDHLCPVRKRCGALNRGSMWENRDCTEELYFMCT